MNSRLAKVLEEVKTLSAQERRELQAALQTLDGQPSETMTEEALLRRMSAEGKLTPATRPLRKVQPVPCTGQSVSELIVEERR